MRISTSLLIAVCFFQTYSVQARECKPWQTDFQKKTDLKVGVISITTHDIFDLSNPQEKTVIHKLANKLHIHTNPHIIRHQLLFKEGDKFQYRKLAEVERNLRARRYIKSAKVTATELCGNKVNIDISTQDNWSLTPGISFSRSGGNNRSGVEIQEHNFLGLGKSLSINYKSNIDRSSKLFAYEDQQLFGSHKKLLLGYQDNSDGKGYDVDLSLPFYELDSQKSWGVSTHKLKQRNTLYKQGEIINKITTRDTDYSLFYGWSDNRKNNSVTRYKVGWSFNKTEYLDSDKQILLPSRIQESYPWFEYNKREEKFIKKTNFKTMGKIEDVSLGKNITIGAALLLKEFSSDNDQLKLSANYLKGYELTDNMLGFIQLGASSYLGKGPLQGETFSISTELNHFNKSGNDLRLALNLKSSSNQKPEEQLILGGDTGLRGYPRAFQTGNKLILLQAEKRFHFDWYPYHFAKFGAVLFADAGTAWGDNNNAKLLADVGIGLRMIPTRSSSSKTLHLDLAFPLVDRKNADSLYFVIKTSQSF